MSAAAPTKPRLTVRRPVIDQSATPKYWVLGDPQSTHALNILHFGIPAGERYFIDSVRLAMRYITDDRLRAEAKAFVGQETVHARLHEQAAEHLDLFDQPLVKPIVDAADRARLRLYKRVDRLPEPYRRRATIMWLSTTLLGEHFTALFADQVFDEAKVDQDSVAPAMRDLIRWHAAEELEHRVFPYDLYLHIGGDYVTRAVPALVGIPAMIPGLVMLTSYLMLVDPDIRRPVSARHYMRAVRARRTPNLLDIAAQLPVYLRPHHHPRHVAKHDAEARAYLQSIRGNVTPRSAPRRAHQPSFKVAH
jgi:predicted metal-dependent hydrolase